MMIRAAQMKTFEQAAYEAFCAKLSRDIRFTLPEVVLELSDEALLTSVIARVRQAESFGLNDRSDIRRYVECSYVLKWPELDLPGEALEVLTNLDLTAEERIDCIEQWTAHV